MIKKFGEFITESLRDKMIPISKETLKNNLSKFDNIFDKIDFIRKHKLDDEFLPSDKDIKKELSKKSTIQQVVLVKRHNLDDKFLPPKQEIKDYYDNQLHLAVKNFKRLYNFLDNLSFEYTEYDNTYEDYAISSPLNKEQVEELGYEFDESVVQYIDVHIEKPFASRISFNFAEKGEGSKMTQFIDRMRV